MTEIERLKSNLDILHKAYRLSGMSGKIYLLIDRERDILRQRIGDLEAQEQVDPWERARGYVDHALKHYMPSNGLEIAKYARHLQAKVAELDHELRCERIDGGKLRDDLRAEIAELKAKTEREQLELCKECSYPLSDCGPPSVDGTPTTDCKACQHRAKTTDWAWAKHLTSVFLHHRYDGENIWLLATYAKHLEEQLSKATNRNPRTVEQLREKIAELTTILNAIPPVCGLAWELVKRRIEGVMKEMQEKQQKGDAGKTTDELDPRRVLATARDILKHYSQFISAEDGWETKNIQQAINTINFMAGTEAEPLKWEKQPHQSELEAKNES